MKESPLYEKHIDLNARMVDFSGFQMPLHYSGIIQEHVSVRNNCGIFDVSHMGEFMVHGSGGESFLNTIMVNDVSVLEIGQAQYSAMCLENGGIIDDIIIYKLRNTFMLVVNGSNMEKDLGWLNKHKPENVQIENISDETGLIAIQGPKSRRILQTITNIDLWKMKFYTFAHGEINGTNCTISRTGYTGELGFEVYAGRCEIRNIWDSIMNTEKVTPCGLGSRDTLRLEMKFCLYGNDIDETTNPIEAGLGWITKTLKPKFMGKKAILHAKENTENKLIAFEMVDRAIPRQRCNLMMNGEKIGYVTSGTQSPSLKKGIGLGYIHKEFCKIGTEFNVEIRGLMKKAIIVKPPFYKNGTAHT